MKIEFNTAPFEKLDPRDPDIPFETLKSKALDYFIKELGHIYIDFKHGRPEQGYCEYARIALKDFLLVLKECE